MSETEGLTLQQFEENFPIAQQPWAHRIPAAIARVKALFPGRPGWLLHTATCDDGTVAHVTPGELALADWAWETFYNSPEYNGERTPPPVVLIAFTEKIESLDHSHRD